MFHSTHPAPTSLLLLSMIAYIVERMYFVCTREHSMVLFWFLRHMYVTPNLCRRLAYFSYRKHWTLLDFYSSFMKLFYLLIG